MATPRIYVDETNVETAIIRAERRDPPALINALERQVVVHTLARRGWTTDRIAAALGTTARCIERHRANQLTTRKEPANVH